MKVRILIALILVLVVYYDCQSQVVRIKLENCTVDKKTLSQIQNALSYQLRFYAKVFNQPADTSFRARVFGSEKEFVKWSKEHANYNPVRNHSIAYYDPTLNEMILHKEVPDFAKVFSHEVSHSILDHYCTGVSTWLHEGLAQFLEDVVANDSAFYIAKTQEPKIRKVEQLFDEGRSVKEPLTTKSFYEAPALWRNYPLSFAVVLYLFQAKREVLAKLIRSDCEGAYDAIKESYPEGLELLQLDVKSWFLNYQATVN
ncbi:MAG: DUF1570 domain-containing protein [Chryseolinea sp.]